MATPGRDWSQPVEAMLSYCLQPPRDDGGDRLPALILLHGRGADEFDLFSLAGELDPRLLVLSVRAPFLLGPGYHWYELQAIGVPEPATFDQSLGLLEQFIAQIMAGYGIEPGRLFLLGFSQGAVMSGALTLVRPRRYGGTLLLSGYLPLHSGLAIDESALPGRPFFVAHGVYDSVISVDFGREARDYLTQVGADLSYHEYPMAHQIVDTELRELNAWLSGRIDAALESRSSQPAEGSER